ncbi:hypothetical protein [Streptomyces sp. 891-h]|uniref:hypothetical protein n=1 Tax=Streptomyces sp. 891-h TaxID=2720714 RepID=UPI001FA97A47|nr:hypothetical protein [Streptomyces sp. 891-h]UNZ18169.1 hypothetical protein HC362_15070 [Streptomyces sp. 891-h]
MPQYPTADSPCPHLSDAIRIFAPSAELARVYPRSRGVMHLFSSDFRRVHIEQSSAAVVAHLVRDHFSSFVDWRRAHDFHLPTGTLYLTPEPQQQGYVPEDDFTFGLNPFRRIEISGNGHG